MFRFLPFAVCLISAAAPQLVAESPASPYPPSPVITGISFDWSNHIRLAPGSDNWPVTWADDDHQYTVWGDGGGFGGTNGIGRNSLGVARLEGNWHAFTAANVWGGYASPHPHSVTGKSYGIISVDGVLTMWVGLFETEVDPFGEVKLAQSTDHGATWTFTDWSLHRTDAVMMPTFLNFGRDNAGARDGYVYSYLIRFQSYEGPDDYEDKAPYLNVQRPGLIDLARAPANRLMQRDAYEFFTGLDAAGAPTWSADLNRRQPVFTNPDGVGWCISASHNAGLDRILLASEHTESHRGHFALYDAPEPWGPWTTVLYATGWGEGHVPRNTFYWTLPNKWLGDDGRAFSLIFTGRKENDSFNVIRGRFKTATD